MRFSSGLLPQLWLNTLREIEQPDTETVKDWFSGGLYAVTAIPAATSFTILVHDERLFCRKLALEINKWASASFESVAAIRADAKTKHATAWPLIQTYYAAFFAAHAIMRSFGNLCSQLETRQTAGIYQSGLRSGIIPAAQLNNGFYRLRYDRSLGTITGDLMVDSHADTWREFYQLIDGISINIQNATGLAAIKADAFSLLDDLKNVLRDGNPHNLRGNWLSQFRNQVNYQKSFGVWYPYKKNNPTLAEMLGLLDRWRERHADFDFPPGQSDVRRFIEATTFIIWVAREIVLLLSGARIQKNHFLDRGGLDFLRFAKWHI